MASGKPKKEPPPVGPQAPPKGLKLNAANTSLRSKYHCKNVERAVLWLAHDQDQGDRTVHKAQSVLDTIADKASSWNKAARGKGRLSAKDESPGTRRPDLFRQQPGRPPPPF